jgi:hypothetical protein
MSRIRLGLVLLLSLVVVELNCPLWGQTSTAQLAPPFAAELVDALATEDSSTQPPVCDKDCCQSCNRGEAKSSCVKSEQVCSSTDQRCELCPGSCNSHCLAQVNADSQCECCENDGSALPQCTSKTAESPAQNIPDSSTAKYCQRMAKMLAITMESPDASNKDRQQAIESALMMIAESVQAQASAQIRENETFYHRELAILRAEFARLAAVNEANDQIRQWMTPIYANQNRNFRQLQVLDAKQVSFNQTLKMMEHRLAQKLSKKSDPPTRPTAVSVNLKDETPQFQSVPPRLSEKLEKAIEIQQQIDQLQEQLRQIRQSSSSVRPVGHLEPLFTPDQPLRPISQKR